MSLVLLSMFPTAYKPNTCIPVDALKRASEFDVDAVEKPLFSRIIDTKKRRGFFHAVLIPTVLGDLAHRFDGCPDQVIVSSGGHDAGTLSRSYWAYP